MSGIQDWSSTPADNDDAPPVGAPENHDRTDVNDIAREMMSSVRADWDGTATGGGEWRNPVEAFTVSQVSGTQISIIGVDATAFFVAGRKVWIDQGTDAYAFVASSSFGGGNTTVNLENFDSAGSGAVTADIATINFHNSFGGGRGIGTGAFEDAGGSLFTIPTALTAAAINTAITTAQSEGKIVLLDDSEYIIESPGIVLKTGVSIWGRGMRGSTSLKQDYNGYVITSAGSLSNITLRDFSINGSRSGKTAGGGIALGASDQGILIENVLVADAYEYGVSALSPASDKIGLTMRNVDVDISGDDGFHIADPSNRRTRDTYDGLTVFKHGQNASNSSGVFIEGIAHLSGVHVRLESTIDNYGIKMEFPGVAGSPAGSRRCTLTGFHVEGGGAGQVGLWVGSNNSAVSNGVVKLTGSTAIPLSIDGRGSSPESAEGNIVSNVQLIGGQRCTIIGDAPSSELLGCRFIDQTGNQLEVSANDTLVKDCSFVTSSGTIGVVVTGSADDVDILGCTFRDQSSYGVQVDAASSDTRIHGNTFRDIGISDINDSGTDTVVRGNSPREVSRYIVVQAEHLSFGSSIYDIPEWSDLGYPPVGANGSERYRIDLSMLITFNSSTNVTVAIHSGALGTNGDPVIASWTAAIGASTFNARFSPFLYAPGSDHTLTVSIDTDTSNTDLVAATELNGYALEVTYVDG